jgi:hypothetical protein
MAKAGDHAPPDLASYDAVAVTTRFWVYLYIGVAAFWRGDFAGAKTHLHEAQELAGYVLAHLDTAWCAFFWRWPSPQRPAMRQNGKKRCARSALARTFCSLGRTQSGQLCQQAVDDRCRDRAAGRV